MYLNFKQRVKVYFTRCKFRRSTMGRQINYYMDLESYKLLVQKAFNLGFKVVVEDKKNIKIYDSIENVEFKQIGIYFYLEEVGELVFSELH